MFQKVLYRDCYTLYIYPVVPFSACKVCFEGTYIKYVIVSLQLATCICILLSLYVDFAAQAADIFVFSSDVSVSGRVSFAISSPDSAGVIKENVKRQTGS